MLSASAWLPWAFLALPAGVLSDRVRKRRLLVASGFGRAAVLAVVPIGYAFHFLSIPELLVIAVLEGSLNVVYSITSTSYVPALVGKPRLLDANSKILTTRSVASLGAPGLGGYLVQAIGAALTVWASTIAFVVGGVLTLMIRRPEQLAERAAHHPTGFVAEVTEGLHLVFANPTLRLLVAALATGNLGGFGAQALQRSR
jgi:MFS family permease